MGVGEVAHPLTGLVSLMKDQSRERIVQNHEKQTPPMDAQLEVDVTIMNANFSSTSWGKPIEPYTVIIWTVGNVYSGFPETLTKISQWHYLSAETYRKGTTVQVVIWQNKTTYGSISQALIRRTITIGKDTQLYLRPITHIVDEMVCVQYSFNVCATYEHVTSKFDLQPTWSLYIGTINVQVS